MDPDEGHVIPPGCVEVSRVMHPDDANPAGNVHGGTILKMIEEAGEIVATRYCNKPNGSSSDENSCWAVLARVERTDFLQPMFIGEVAQVHAEISYASERSVEVKFLVWAENLLTGNKRLTNKAWMWYVPVKILGDDKRREVGRVPTLVYPNKEMEEAGRKRYEQQKKQREDKQKYLEKIPNNCSRALFPDPNSPPHSVPSSQSTLIHPVNPSDCNKFGYVHGGVTMKLMDTVAGITAFRHCRTNIVTASIAPVDFHEPVSLGTVLTFTGRLTFTSTRSMEIEVMVDAENIRKGSIYRACSAYFTFVSLDANRHPQAVPPLMLLTDEEKERWEQGKKRYEERKRMRTLSSEEKK